MQKIWIGIIVNIFGRDVLIVVGEHCLLLVFSGIVDNVSIERT